jgi:hypothetical protein
MSDSFDLQRFVDAQAAIYPRVVEELLRDENRHTGCGSFFSDRRSRLQRHGYAVSKQQIFAEAIAAFYPDEKDEILETSRPL